MSSTTALLLIPPAGGNVYVAPITMIPFMKTTNPIFNSLAWLENVLVGSKIDIYVFESINGEEAAFCHGKTAIKPWETQGVDGGCKTYIALMVRGSMW